MRDLELGQLVRRLRRRRGWRQQDCAHRAGLHRSTWSRLEHGHLDRLNLDALRRCLAVLEVRLEMTPRWRGSNLDRLLDEDHAALQAAWAERLRSWGWEVRVEVSFNHYGDRGRIDLLAWHPGLAILVVGEIKAEVADAQGVLGPLDVKVRVAPRLSASLGWGRPRIVVPLLIIRDTTTARDRLRRLAPLFAAFSIRGRQAVGLLRHPGRIAGGSLLILSDLRSAAHRHVTRAGGQRVRIVRPKVSTEGAAAAASRRRRPG